jgi:hypothetical protein
VRTDLTLAQQAIREESFKQGGERRRVGHGRSSHRRSRRRIASCISSGHALRYQ